MESQTAIRDLEIASICSLVKTDNFSKLLSKAPQFEPKRVARHTEFADPNSRRFRPAATAARPMRGCGVKIAAGGDATRWTIAVVETGVARRVAEIERSAPLPGLARRAKAAHAAVRVDPAGAGLGAVVPDLAA